MITTLEGLIKLDGKKVKCEIWGKKIEDSRIRIEDGEIFVCQNEVMGKDAKNKLGYEYSYSISRPFDCPGDRGFEYFKIEPLNITQKAEEKMAEINSRLDLLTPAIINDASETWQKFTDAWNALYHKAKKIKSKKTLETLTAKTKEI